MTKRTSAEVEIKLFLDGVETPVQSVRVNEKFEKPSTCSITIPPHPKIEKVPEKTLVHVFYKFDQFGTETDNDKEYKLLFEGYVTGNSTNYSQNSLNKVINAADLSHILTEMLIMQTFASNPYASITKSMKIYNGEEPVRLADEELGSDIKSRIASSFAQANSLGEGIKSAFDTLSSLHTFLSDIRKRFRFMDRFPNLNNELNIMNEDFIVNRRLDAILQDRVQQASGQNVIYELLNSVLGMFLHTFSSNASVLNTFNIVPNLINGSPPSCNIITPNMFNKLNFSENYTTKPTREAYKVSSPVSNENKGLNSIYLYPENLDNPVSVFNPDEKDDMQDSFTDEELLVGVRPDTTPSSQVFASDIDDFEKQNKFFMNHARYNFEVNRRNSNKMNIRGSFNPECFPGFSSYVILPGSDVYYGQLTSVTHSTSQGNNTATTRYNISLPIKLLNSGEDYKPEINPALSGKFSDEERITERKLGELYNGYINNFWQNSAIDTQGDVSPLQIYDSGQELLPEIEEKYFNERFDLDKYKDNPVLARAVVALGQWINKEGEIVEPNRRRRAHYSIEDVFSGFYKSNKVGSENEKNKTSRDIWDIFAHPQFSQFENFDTNLNGTAGDIDKQPIQLQTEFSEDIVPSLRKRQTIIMSYNRSLDEASGSMSMEFDEFTSNDFEIY